MPAADAEAALMRRIDWLHLDQLFAGNGRLLDLLLLEFGDGVHSCLHAIDRSPPVEMTLGMGSPPPSSDGTNDVQTSQAQW